MAGRASVEGRALLGESPTLAIGVSVAARASTPITFWMAEKGTRANRDACIFTFMEPSPDFPWIFINEDSLL